MSWQNVVLSQLLRWRTKPLSKREPDPARAREFVAKTFRDPLVPKGWRVRQGTDAALAGDWIEPADGAPAARTLLYFHGGGYCFCSPATHRPITFALATGADARAVAPVYRLAPEHRFPAAVEDAVAAYRRLVALGTPPSRIVVGGDSAGGGLALAALLSLRDAGDTLPAGAVLFSPWTDLAATGASLVTNDRRDVMFHGYSVAKGARVYLGDAPATHPLASPLYGDLRALPPLFVQVSDSEVILDDSTRLAAKATAAGVTVDLKQWHRLPHVWQIFAPRLPEARAALAEAAAFIRRVTP
ncbi:MAG TPA: alpha/beta hydrolase [Stellaceae bacterium]|jgi:monoterpene epsilon-lactone hydrolase|nr:alpha/beta hydrolase [Stellaceae bacterium]